MSQEGYTVFGGYISWLVVNERLPNDIEFKCNIDYRESDDQHVLNQYNYILLETNKPNL